MNKLSGQIAANHIHYKYTSQQIADLSPEARQRFEWAYKYDPNPEALITDADLDYIVEYDSLTDTISGGKHSVQFSALGVTLLDPENLDPLENTAFDTVAIMDNVEDGGTLSDLYVQVSSTEDEGVMRDYVQLIRQYSTYLMNAIKALPIPLPIPRLSYPTNEEI